MKSRRHRRTETTTETHEVWVVKSPPVQSPAWCPECAGRSVMLTPEEAARLLRVNPRMIYRWVEGGQTHFRELEDGWLLICLASLPTEATSLVSRNSGPSAPG
jgi:Helix-turn-helix domain